MKLRKKQEFDLKYDKEYDDLFLFDPQEKSKGSIELGDIILDLNKMKQLVGIQLINASELIADLVDKSAENVKKILNTSTSCKIEIKSHRNLNIIKIYLISKGKKKLSPKISVRDIERPSPALAHA